MACRRRSATATDQTLRLRCSSIARRSRRSVLLPIVGILLVTSEWSQRTALITFTLVPRRERVLGAKLPPGWCSALVAFVICVVVAALGNLAVGGGRGRSPPRCSARSIISVATGMVIGVGFGALFLATAPAIVCSFLLPTAFAAVGSLAPFRGAATWLDQTRALGPLTEHSLSASEWAHAGAALALWMVVPLAVGLVRIMRSDVA